jgi:hypothetical protein
MGPRQSTQSHAETFAPGLCQPSDDLISAEESAPSSSHNAVFLNPNQPQRAHLGPPAYSPDDPFLQRLLCQHAAADHPSAIDRACNELGAAKYINTFSIATGLGPLHIAAQRGCAQAFSALVRHGANMGFCSIEGKRAIDYAVAAGHREIVKIIVNAHQPTGPTSSSPQLRSMTMASEPQQTYVRSSVVRSPTYTSVNEAGVNFQNHDMYSRTSSSGSMQQSEAGFVGGRKVSFSGKHEQHYRQSATPHQVQRYHVDERQQLQYKLRQVALHEFPSQSHTASPVISSAGTPTAHMQAWPQTPSAAQSPRIGINANKEPPFLSLNGQQFALRSPRHPSGVGSHQNVSDMRCLGTQACVRVCLYSVCAPVVCVCMFISLRTAWNRLSPSLYYFVPLRLLSCAHVFTLTVLCACTITHFYYTLISVRVCIYVHMHICANVFLDFI